MVNGIRKIYSRELNKGFGSKLLVGSRVRHEIPEEGRWSHRPKCWDIAIKMKTIVELHQMIDHRIREVKGKERVANRIWFKDIKN